MSDTVLVLILATTILSVLLLWLPLLHAAEALSRDYPTERSGDLLNLIEEDSGPQFTGDVA